MSISLLSLVDITLLTACVWSLIQEIRDKNTAWSIVWILTIVLALELHL